LAKRAKREGPFTGGVAFLLGGIELARTSLSHSSPVSVVLGAVGTLSS
jgi:hypothetical protein